MASSSLILIFTFTILAWKFTHVPWHANRENCIVATRCVLCLYSYCLCLLALMNDPIISTYSSWVLTHLVIWLIRSWAWTMNLIYSCGRIWYRLKWWYWLKIYQVKIWYEVWLPTSVSLTVIRRYGASSILEWSGSFRWYETIDGGPQGQWPFKWYYTRGRGYTTVTNNINIVGLFAVKINKKTFCTSHFPWKYMGSDIWLIPGKQSRPRTMQRKQSGCKMKKKWFTTRRYNNVLNL